MNFLGAHTSIVSAPYPSMTQWYTNSSTVEQFWCAASSLQFFLRAALSLSSLDSGQYLIFVALLTASGQYLFPPLQNYYQNTDYEYSYLWFVFKHFNVIIQNMHVLEKKRHSNKHTINKIPVVATWPVKVADMCKETFLFCKN